MKTWSKLQVGSIQGEWGKYYNQVWIEEMSVKHSGAFAGNRYGRWSCLLCLEPSIQKLVVLEEKPSWNNFNLCASGGKMEWNTWQRIHSITTELLKAVNEESGMKFGIWMKFKESVLNIWMRNFGMVSFGKPQRIYMKHNPGYSSKKCDEKSENLIIAAPDYAILTNKLRKYV